jgi:hypothetical protein
MDNDELLAAARVWPTLREQGIGRGDRVEVSVRIPVRH